MTYERIHKNFKSATFWKLVAGLIHQHNPNFYLIFEQFRNLHCIRIFDSLK